MTQPEPNDWTLIATQLLREAGEIRARFDVVTDPEERQRLRDRYFQIDRLLDLARQMTEAKAEQFQQAPEQNTVAPPEPAPQPVVQQASEPESPPSEPMQAEAVQVQPFYFERAVEPATVEGAAEESPQSDADGMGEVEESSLVVEVVEEEGASSEALEPDELISSGDEGLEAHPRAAASSSRPQVNVRHVRRIGPKLERQSRNRPLSKRAIKARVQLGELTESEALAQLESEIVEETPVEAREATLRESLLYSPSGLEEPEGESPELVSELHKEFAEFPPPELPKQPAVVLEVQPVPMPQPEPVQTPIIVPAAAASRPMQAQPVEVIEGVAEPVQGRPSATWELRRAAEPSSPQPVYSINPAEPAIRGALETAAVTPVVVVEAVSPRQTPADEPLESALPFTPLSRRTKRVASPARFAPAPAASEVQNAPEKGKEAASRLTPRELRRRVIEEAGGRSKASPDGSDGGSEPTGAGVQPRWPLVQGQHAAGSWQARHRQTLEPSSPRLEDAAPEEIHSLQSGSSAIRPKLRPGEKWPAMPIVERVAERELPEPSDPSAQSAMPMEKPPMRVVEPLPVPSVPSSPPSDWAGPAVLPVSRRNAEMEAAPVPAYRNANAEASFAEMTAGADRLTDTLEGYADADALERSRAKPYSGALALPATTRDTPNQYKVWLERAGHEPFVVRRQYFLIRAYIDRYGGPFTREVIVLRHLQKAESIDDFLAMKYYAILALTEVAKLVRGGSTSEIEVLLLNAEESPIWEKKAHQALIALYMLVKPKRTEYGDLAEKEREIAQDAPAPTDQLYYLIRAMMVKRVGPLHEQLAIRRVFEQAQDEWLVWESLVAAAYEALLEVDLFNADSLTRVSPAASG